MSDGIFSSFKVSAMGLRAQRIRLDVASENLANAETTRTPEGGPYRPKAVSFAAQPVDRPRPGGLGGGVSFRQLLAAQDSAAGVNAAGPSPGAVPGIGVEARVGEISNPFVSEYAPNHPDADENGIVLRPNVDAVGEMMTLIKATRAYEANATAMDAAKDMLNRALDI